MTYNEGCSTAATFRSSIYIGAMNPVLPLFTLLLLLFHGSAPAQTRRRFFPPPRPHRPERPRRTPDPTYRLHHRVFVKWTPSALIPISAASVRLGAEYCTRGNLGLALDAGYVFPASQQSNWREFNGGPGWILNPEARLYFGFRRNGRGFTGIQGLYRQQYFGSKAGTIGISGYAWWYRQSAATLQVIGAAPEIGFVVGLGSGLHLEWAAGVGAKRIDWDRRDLVMTRTWNSYHYYNYQYTENDVLNKEVLPYFFMQLKFSWLLGPGPKKVP